MVGLEPQYLLSQKVHIGVLQTQFIWPTFKNLGNALLGVKKKKTQMSPLQMERLATVGLYSLQGGGAAGGDGWEAGCI